MICHKLSVRDSMNPKYKVGQKVKIKPADSEHDTSPRDCAIDAYAGQIGEITNYYWVSPRVGEVFYIYVVRVGTGYKEIALHEDEIEASISSKSLKARDCR
jgi:ribosomal protein L21E